MKQSRGLYTPMGKFPYTAQKHVHLHTKGIINDLFMHVEANNASTISEVLLTRWFWVNIQRRNIDQTQ